MRIKRITGWCIPILATMLLFVLVLFPTIALAASASSNPKYATVNGYSYKYYTVVATEGSNAYASTYAVCTSGSAPTGYMGANSILYKDGVIPVSVASRDWAYNTSSTTSYMRGCGMTAAAGSSYYAAGSVRFYNGGGYNTYSANRSPSLTYYSVFAAQADQLQTRTIEELCGGFTASGRLILAEGINGEIGFITYEDLGFDYIPSSPEEAVAYTLSQPDVRYIPVYDGDGVTVIDLYPVFGGNDTDWGGMR